MVKPYKLVWPSTRTGALLWLLSGGGIDEKLTRKISKGLGAFFCDHKRLANDQPVFFQPKRGDAVKCHIWRQHGEIARPETAGQFSPGRGVADSYRVADARFLFYAVFAHRSAPHGFEILTECAWLNVRKHR